MMREQQDKTCHFRVSSGTEQGSTVVVRHTHKCGDKREARYSVGLNFKRATNSQLGVIVNVPSQYVLPLNCGTSEEPIRHSIREQSHSEMLVYPESCDTLGQAEIDCVAFEAIWTIRLTWAFGGSMQPYRR